MRLADLIREFRAPLEDRYRDRLLPSHHQAMDAILACRTPAAGEMIVQCPHCGKLEWRAHSCGNRSCPRCQNHETGAWLDRQREKLLPVPNFLVTFTVPAALRSIAWNHQRAFFGCLFQAAATTLQFLAKDPRRLGGSLGMTGVLHTHSRRLDFHPHVHFVVPGGGIDAKARFWKRTPGRFLFPQRVMSRIFRARLAAAMRRQGWKVPKVFRNDWVVHCRSVGSGDRALTYLGRYLYRGVIPERCIHRLSDGRIAFTYREAGTRAWKRRVMRGEHLLWKILAHVLPRGFRRARDHGFLHGNARKTLRLIQILLRATPAAREPQPRPAFRCPDCGKDMVIRAFLGKKRPNGPGPPPG